MKSSWCSLLLLVLAFSVGCQRQQDVQKEPLQQVQKEPTEERIEISDLMDALEIHAWKASVNQPGRPAVKRVSLCVKRKASDPQTIASVDLSKDGDMAAPGKLLVLLQEPGVKKPGWFWVVVTFHAESGGRSERVAGWVEDPFAEKSRLRRIHTDTDIASTGIILLRDYLPMAGSRTLEDVKEEMFGAKDIESDKNVVAIYLKNE